MSTATKQDVVVTESEAPEVPERNFPATISAFHEIDRLMERLMPRGWLRPFRWDFFPGAEMLASTEMHIPAVDVIDEDLTLLVRAELPGTDKKDIDVTASENTLVIKTRASSERKIERGSYFLSEISQGASSRTIHLPCNVDPGHVKATLKDGILEVVLQKVDGSKRRHQVAVE